MKNKENCLKVELLHKLRLQSEKFIGVFSDYEDYVVVGVKYRYINVSSYPRDKDKYNEQYYVFKYGSLEEAKKKCDEYRRQFILSKIRELKYGTIYRYY